MMDPVVNDADHKEHAGRADAVGNHLEHRPVHAHLPVVGIVLRAATASTRPSPARRNPCGSPSYKRPSA